MPAYVLMRCRMTLFKLREFESDELLRTVFVTPELALYREGLPFAISKGERIDKTIAYLLQKQSLKVEHFSRTQPRYGSRA